MLVGGPASPQQKRKNRAPFLGYRSKELREKAKYKHQIPASIVIQRTWRGAKGRQYAKSMEQGLREHAIRRHVCARIIQRWFRRCLQVIHAKEELIELRYIAHCRLTLQRVWRGHRGRLQYHQRFDRVIELRLHGAKTAQRIVRGFLGRRCVRHMKEKAMCFRMAARIASFFQRSVKSVNTFREKVHNRRSAATLVIQKYARRMLARR